MEGSHVSACRIAYGGMAAIPARATGAEAALEGHAPLPERFAAAIDALAEDFQPMSDVRGSSDYRRHAAAALIERLRLVVADAASQDSQHPTQEVMLHAYAH